MRIDLDAAQAAESEAKGEAHVIVAAGVEMHLPSDVKMVPVAAIIAMEADKTVGFVSALVEPEEWDAYMATRPTMKDLERLSIAIGKLYGFSASGESPASSDSSVNTSEPSRPTSLVTTDSTSQPSAGATTQEALGA